MSACGRDVHYCIGCGMVEAYYTRCKSWMCAECAPFKLRKLRGEIARGQPDMLMTLTSNPAIGETPAERAFLVVASFQKFIKRAARHLKLKRISYFVVIEATKRGEPHLHVAMRCPFIPQRLLAAWWQAYTGAHIVRVERIRSQHAVARYISKYLSKSPVTFRATVSADGEQRSRQTRRYWHSQDWCVVTVDKKQKIAHVAGHRILRCCSLSKLALALRGDGWQIVKLSSEGLLAVEPHQGAPPPLWECTVELESYRTKFTERERGLAA